MRHLPVGTSGHGPTDHDRAGEAEFNYLERRKHPDMLTDRRSFGRRRGKTQRWYVDVPGGTPGFGRDQARQHPIPTA